MGRKGSIMIPFFINALFSNKYENLRFLENSRSIFTLNLPQKSGRLSVENQLILKDWNVMKGRKYRFKKSYTRAKQGMEAAIRRSDYLEVLQSGRNKSFICKLLDSEEVKAKKLRKKAQKAKSKEDELENVDSAPPSIESSGYGSGADSPVHFNDHENCGDHALTHTIKHDENNHALLYALEHDHECMTRKSILSEKDLNLMKNELHPIENEGELRVNALPFGGSEEHIISPSLEIGNAPLVDSVVSSSSLNLDSSLTFDANFGNLGCSFSVPESCTNNLNQLFNIDDFINPSSDDTEFDELIRSLCDKLPDLEEYFMGNEISATVDPSFKTELCKVYECIHRQDLPGIVLLTCEPKMMEFNASDNKDNEPNPSRILFDAATMQVVSSCIIEDIKLLNNDYILVILSTLNVKGLLMNSLPNIRQS